MLSNLNEQSTNFVTVWLSTVPHRKHLQTLGQQQGCWRHGTDLEGAAGPLPIWDACFQGHGWPAQGCSTTDILACSGIGSSHEAANSY